MLSSMLRKVVPALALAALMAVAAGAAQAAPSTSSGAGVAAATSSSSPHATDAALAERGRTPKPTVHQGPLVFHDADTETWTPCEGLSGCTQLLVRGNPATGASEAVFRFKAGTPFAAHYHTSPEHVVGVAGIMQYVIGGTTYYVGPGDFLYYPGGAVHRGICSSGADCEFFVYDDLPYDIFPA